ncbi:hypothetical protein MHK_002006, partial [Candidatus Magnetomorum sp. HK-1]
TTSYYKNPPAIKTIKTSLSNDNSCQPHIIINVDPSEQSSNYAIESYLDDGIMPVNISHQGQWDERTHTIRWGLLRETKEVSYDIYGENGTYQISGMISINGVSMPAYEIFSVNVDCYLSIEQGDSILVVMDEDGVFNSPNISAIGPDPELLTWETADSPMHGTVTVSGTGLSPEMNYMPNKNWHGSDHFNIKVSDNNGAMDFIRVNINVNSINDPPVFKLGSSEIDLGEDFSVPQFMTITMLPPPFEEEETIGYRLHPEKIECAKVTIDDAKGKIIITSKPEANGSETIHLIASDGQLSYTQTFQLNVRPINDPPFFTLNTNSISLEEDFSEPHYLSIVYIYVPKNENNQKVTYSIVPESVDWIDLQINSDTGRITIRPIPDKNGTQSFTIIADDRQETNNKAYQSLTLTIQNEPDPPEFIISKDELKLKEDFTGTSIISITPLPVPDDEKNKEVSYSLYPKAVNWADIQINYHPLQVEISAIENASGNRTFSIIASDGESEAYKDFKLIIEPVNDPPVTIIDSVPEINEGSILTLNGYQSFDIDNEVLSFQWEQVSGVPVIIDNINNYIAYVQIPKITQHTDQLTFRLTVSDGDISVPEEIDIDILDVAIPGDINDDGLVDMFDLVAILELISNIDVSEDALFENYADVNQNGSIDLGDVVYVFQQIMKYK